MILISRMALGAALIASISSVAQAQTAASLGEVSGRLKTGDKVYVAAGDTSVKGSILEISPSSLSLLVNGQRREFSGSELTRIQREKRSTRRGALIGLLAGGVGVPAVVYTIVERNCAASRGTIHACDDEWGADMIAIFFGGIGGGIGAGAGAGVGALFKHRETVFAKHAGAMVVKPIVDRSRKGLAVSIGF
jgi:hypothetical protein